MHLFFDPSVLPVTTTDLDGNILYVRTHGLYHYGYPDIIAEKRGEEPELLLLDILDRIFSMDFNINAAWNYNGRIFRLEKADDGLAHVVYQAADEARIITILNPDNGQPAKFITKGLMELYHHPEAEIAGEVPFGKDIIGYLIDQVKVGTVYDEDTLITYDEYVYGISCSHDRRGNPFVEIHLHDAPMEQSAKTHKRKANHLMLIK